MTTGATGQLGLALPVQGELSGTWGDTVNNGITQYTNIAIAATLTLTNDGAVTLANTTGDASASNITSSLTGAGTVTAQFAIVRITGTLTTTKVVTAPSYSKTYVVVNAATGGTVTFKASGQTGVSIAVGESAWVYYNGTDYVKIVGTATAGAAGGSNTQVQYNSSGVLAGSSNMTFDGTNLTIGGSTTAARFIPSGSTVATNGMYLPAANSLGFSTNSTLSVTIDSTQQIGIGSGTAAGQSVRMAKAITGSVNSYGLINAGIVQSDVTSNAYYFRSSVSTAASAFTLTALSHYSTIQGTIGAGSAVTNQYGYYADSTLTGATNNYGFFGNIASGTGRWNFYAAGTAANYFAGNVGIGTTTTTNKLEIGGSGDSIMRLLAAGQSNGLELGQLTADGGSKIFAANNNYIAFGTNNTERARIDSSGNLLVGTTATAAAKLTIASTTNPALTLPNIAEIATISATAATGTINYDATTQSVLYYTTNASGNFTMNIRGNSGLSLNSMLSTGQSVTMAFLCTNGGTAYYQSAMTIDGTSVTPKWQGGTAPSSGNASSIDVYSYTIIKTASATFTVLASQTKFA